MVRAPYVDKNGLKRGAWSREEDDKLRAYVLKYGHWNWRALPKFAGLSRCGKSCRLRWINYLKPGVKHGNYSKEEEDLIIILHTQFGNKWSKIAEKLPGRTDNEIKNYWHTHLKKRTKKTKTISGSSELYPNTQELSESEETINSTDHSPISASYPLSPESSFSEFSQSIFESAGSILNWFREDGFNEGSSFNWIREDSFSTLETTDSSSGDFWTQPFVTDKDAYMLPSLEAELLSPYFSC